MALSLDIRISNPLEKSAIATAKALEAVAAREKKVNALLERGNVDQKLANAIQRQFVAQKKSIVTQQAKSIVEGKKATTDERKHLSWVKSITREYLFVRDAAKLAFGTIKKLTLDLASLGKDASDSQAAMLYEFNQWAGDNQGAKQMQAVDSVAHKLGMTLEDARSQFVKFRKASEEPLFIVNNADAMRLLKLRADIAAVSKSTRVADEEMDKLLSLVNQPAAFAKLEAQLRKTPEAFRKYGEMGSGAIAAALAPQSLDAAKNRLGDAVKGIGMKFWEKIGPTIGEAANKLGAFIEKFQNSKVFAEILKDITDAFKWLAKEGIPAVIDWIKKFAEAWVGMKDLTSQDIKNFTKDSVDQLTAPGKKFFEDVFGNKEEWKRALKTINPFDDSTKAPNTAPSAPSVPIAPTPAVPRQHGMLQQDVKKQLASNTITIENINVQGGGDAREISRSIRQEMQLLLRAGALSKGLA